jgi:hypothetical protein
MGPFIGCQSLHVPERPVPVLHGWFSVFMAPAGSPKVPVFRVARGIDVTAGAGEVPELRGQVRVVEAAGGRPSRSSASGRRSSRARPRDSSRGSHAETVASKRFKHVEPAPRLIEHEPGRTLTDVDRREARAVGRVRFTTLFEPCRSRTPRCRSRATRRRAGR